MPSLKVVKTPAPVVKAPTPPPVATDWRDAPETQGAWNYRREAAGSAAAFGHADAAADFTIRCDPVAHVIVLTRAGGAVGTMTVTTSYSASSWPTQAGAVTLRAGDPALDRIAFSRGRFTVAVPGLPTLILPVWAEPARVIEDCRF